MDDAESRKPVAGPRHVVLMGSMGVGKTTVGRLVAERLGWPLRDSDEELARRGATGKAMAEQEGVDALHRFERDHVLGALADPEPAVIAAAASVVDDESVVGALQPAFVVWLRATPATVARQAASSTHRRTVGPNPEQGLADLFAEREPAYEQAADLTIDVDTRKPEEIATAVVVAFGQQ